MTSLTDAAAGAPASKRTAQNSKIGPFLWIGFYTSILSVFTLGIFQFWGRTQFRRRLWRETLVEGEPLEYVGKGSEKFLGAILAAVVILGAVAVLVGVPFLLHSIAGAGAGIAAGVGSGILYILAIIVLPGLAVYLARRYVMSRTLLRGVRFEQGGKRLGFALGFFLQNLLTAITFGIYAPIARLRIAEMFWDNAKYGDTPFKFDSSGNARTEPVWPSFFLAYFGNVIALGIFYGAIIWYTLSNPDAMQSAAPPIAFLGVVYGSLLVAVIVALPLVAWHEAVMTRQTIKLISLDGAKLSSDVRAWPLLGLWITNILLIIFTLGFGYFAAQMRGWRFIAKSIEIEGAIDYAKISQSTARGPSTGEGLAEALDIGGAF